MKILGIEFGKEKEKRGIEDAVLYTPVNPFANGGLLFGGVNTQGGAMALSTVYRCVNMIAESVAVLPITIATKDGKTVGNHQLNSVINDNTNRLTKYQLIKLLIQSVLLRGNGFAFIERNADGSPKALRYLEASDVTIIWDKAKNTLYYNCPIVSNKRIEACNMVHLVNNSYDGVNGVPVVSFAGNSIKTAQATEATALNYFTNGGNLNGIIKVSSHLTPQQKIDIKNSWAQTYNGNTGGVAVLEGNMDYQAIQANAEQAQLLPSREYNVTEICRYFGISPVLLGVSGGNVYGTIEAMQTEFVLHTLLPYITMIEQELSRKLLKASETDLTINLDENYLLKGDKQSEANYYSTLINCGVMTINEVRSKLGYTPVEGGDKNFVAYTDVNQNTINKEETNTNGE